MLTIKDYLPIGVFTRAHGAKGEIVLRLQAIEAEDLHKMEWVLVEIDGLPVPFFVQGSRELGSGKLIMSLETVRSESCAKELVGCRLLIPLKGLVKKAMRDTGLPDVKDFVVTDTSRGELGKAIELISIAGNPLLKIHSGKKELLIPAHPDIILEVSVKDKRILTSIPEGLLDL